MRAILALALCLLVAACAGDNASRKKNVASTPAPGWVKSPPQVNGRVYSVGKSGPTFYPQDALNNAAEDARGRLSLALASNMEVLNKSAERGDGTSTRLDLVKAATDMVVQNSVVEATWADTAGEIDEAGSVYALAYVSLAKAHVLKEESVETASEKGVPGWLSRLPSAAGRIYAYGYSGPTRVVEDANDYAKDDAIDNIARTLKSHVQAYSLQVRNNAGVYIDDWGRTLKPDDDFRDLVKQKAKIETTWIDAKGARAGYPAGSVWALGYIEVPSTATVFQPVQNADTGPALNRRGEIDPAMQKRAEPASLKADAKPGEPARTAPPPSVTVMAKPPPAPAVPEREHKDFAGKLAPYPSEGERCKPGYDSSGGWCLPSE